MKVLAIGAHPDDVDFTCGATIARLVESGHEVHYCLVTNGQAGGFDQSVSRLEQAKLRREEQHMAAKVLGVSTSTHLDLQDGALEVTMDFRRGLTRVIRTIRPDLIIAPSPRHNLDNVHFLHPDHLATGEATLAAVYPDSRNQFAFPELGLEPHVVSQVWLLEDPAPDYFVDISGHMEVKLDALKQHSSQFATKENLEDSVYKAAGVQAKLGGSIFLAAEGFKRIVYSELEDLNF